MKTHKYCTQCGQDNRVTAKVCTQCGRHFKTMLLVNKGVERCPQCDFIRRGSAKFCSNCGYRYPNLIAPMPPIIQPLEPGVVLPPAAKIPPLPQDLPEQLPKSANESGLRGKTGILLTPEEFEALRNSKNGQSVFIQPYRSRKKSK